MIQIEAQWAPPSRSSRGRPLSSWAGPILPVKTTNDLLVLRLDVYEVGADSRLSKITDPAPLVDLDSRYYKAIAAFDRRFTSGAPSLRRASLVR